MFCRIARQQYPGQFRMGFNDGLDIVVLGDPDIRIQRTGPLSFNFVADVLYPGFQFLHDRITLLHRFGRIKFCPLQRHTRYIGQNLPEPVAAIGVEKGVDAFRGMGWEAAEDEGVHGGEVAVPGGVGFFLHECVLLLLKNVRSEQQVIQMWL